MIGRVEYSPGGGYLRLAPLVVRSSKESLEVGLLFLLWSETFPNFAFIDEETGLINKLEGHNDELFEAVRIVADLVSKEDRRLDMFI